VEQSIEWKSSLYINFIDFEKAFDSIISGVVEGVAALWDTRKDSHHLFHNDPPYVKASEFAGTRIELETWVL